MNRLATGVLCSTLRPWKGLAHAATFFCPGGAPSHRGDLGSYSDRGTVYLVPLVPPSYRASSQKLDPRAFSLQGPPTGTVAQGTVGKTMEWWNCRLANLRRCLPFLFSGTGAWGIVLPGPHLPRTEGARTLPHRGNVH